MMIDEIEPIRIRSKESLKNVIAADFESLGELPIRGGWGYTRDDAIIIDKYDPISDTQIEILVTDKRTHAELVSSRPENDRYTLLHWNLLDQRLIHHKNRSYDRLTWDITVIPKNDYLELVEEAKGPNGVAAPDLNKNTHHRKLNSKSFIYSAEYWFDITSFFGDHKSMFVWDVDIWEETATSDNGITFKLTDTMRGEYEGLCLNPEDIPPDDLDEEILGKMIKEAGTFYDMERDRLKYWNWSREYRHVHKAQGYTSR
jgi:hypothetical protein